MKSFLLVAAATFAAPLLSVVEASELRPREVPLSVAVEVPVSRRFNISEVCYKLVRKDLSQREWDSFVMKVNSRYDEWLQQVDRSGLKRFLDDRLINLVTGVVSGKGKDLKEFSMWAALYHYYDEQLPSYISEHTMTQKDYDDLAGEVANFDWDRTARVIKEKAGDK